MTKISHDSEILAEGQQVITVCALIYHNFEGVKKVFMPRRAATKKFLPNVYELPGGHVDFGEELIPALLREIHEEFEIDITVEEPFAAFTYLNEIKKIPQRGDYLHCNIGKPVGSHHLTSRRPFRVHMDCTK